MVSVLTEGSVTLIYTVSVMAVNGMLLFVSPSNHMPNRKPRKAAAGIATSHEGTRKRC